MRRILRVVLMACVCPVLLQGQGVQEGTWSGTRVRVPGRQGGNQQPQRVSIEIKKAPDPHSAWRPEKRDVWNSTFITPQGRAQLSDLLVGNESLSFSYRQEVQVTCRLDRQPDGAYQGMCVGAGDGSGYRVTLNPPKGSN
ncbi:MAG: hypothetical protein ACRD2N_02290 [Vicinamibacterales bacterium]